MQRVFEGDDRTVRGDRRNPLQCGCGPFTDGGMGICQLIDTGEAWVHLRGKSVLGGIDCGVSISGLGGSFPPRMRLIRIRTVSAP